MKITFIRPSIGGLGSRGSMEPIASSAVQMPLDIRRPFHDERLAAVRLDVPTLEQVPSEKGVLA